MTDNKKNDTTKTIFAMLITDKNKNIDNTALVKTKSTKRKDEAK